MRNKFRSDIVHNGQEDVTKESFWHKLNQGVMNMLLNLTVWSWAMQSDVDPSTVTLTVTLKRLGRLSGDGVLNKK